MKFVEHPLIKKGTIESRLYQEMILGRAVGSDLLCVLPTGLGKCHAYSDNVLLENGDVIEIGKLVNQHLSGSENKKSFSGGKFSIEKDCDVRLFSLCGNKFNPVKVNSFSKFRSEKLVRIKTRSGSEIGITPEHPLLTIKNDKIFWKHASDFKKDDFILVPKKVSVRGVRNQNIDFLNVFKKVPGKVPYIKFKNGEISKLVEKTNVKIGEIEGVLYLGGRCVNTVLRPVTAVTGDLLRFFGLILAEGRIEGGIKFYNTDKYILDDFKELTKKLFNLDVKKIKGGYKVRCSALVYFLKFLFEMEPQSHSRSKIIPPIVMRSSNEEIAAFLKGFFDGEASVRKDSVIELTTASKDIATKLPYIFLRFGIRTRVERKFSMATNSPVGKRRIYYRVCVEGKEDITRFYTYVGFGHPSKAISLNNIVKSDKIYNTNVDVIPVNKIIKEIRNTLRLKSSRGKDFDFLSDITIYETGNRNPSRTMLKRILNVFEKKWKDKISLRDDIQFIKLNRANNQEKENVKKRLEKIIETLNISGWMLRKNKSLSYHEKIDFILTFWNKIEQIEEKIEYLKKIAYSEIMFDRIKNLKRIQKSDYVYDVTIFDTQNFLCGDFGPVISHNTPIAIVLAVHRLEKFPGSKILVMAPTKPLTEQHFNSFRGAINLPEKDFVLVTGMIKPNARMEMYSKASVIFATPQTIENDLKEKRISLSDFSLVVFDEAHHSVGDYAYPYIARAYVSSAKNPRILGLTASPGGTKAKIREIMDNLGIKEVEIRTEKDYDVGPWVKEKQVEWVYVDLPEAFLEIRNCLKTAYTNRLENLRKIGYNKPVGIISKRDLLELQQRLIASPSRDFKKFWGVSLVSQAIKTEHALGLLETQGITSLWNYFRKLSSDKAKSSKSVLKDKNVTKAMKLSEELEKKGQKHPKIAKLSEIISKQLRSKPDSRIILFANYREMVRELAKVLANVEGARPGEFMGQKEGMSQAEQKLRIQEFREGVYNILVTTSIGEEGIDIPEMELAIFYEPVPSEIRSIQRRGRVGRTKVGRIIILMAKRTRDEAYYWTAQKKERIMRNTLYEMKGEAVRKAPRKRGQLRILDF